MQNLPTEALNSVEGRTFIIGREGHIYVNDPTISKHHAEMSIQDGRIFLRDLDSTNGTFLLEDRKLVPFHEGYVGLDQTVVFGKKLKTPRSLIRTAIAFVN